MTGNSKILLQSPLVYVQNVPLCDFAEQSFLRVSFIELAQNFIAIHCDVMANFNDLQKFCLLNELILFNYFGV